MNTEITKLAEILVTQEPERREELVRRLILLVMDDRGFTADELFGWLANDAKWDE